MMNILPEATQVINEMSERQNGTMSYISKVMSKMDFGLWAAWPMLSFWLSSLSKQIIA